MGCLVAASRTAPVLDAIEDGVHGRLVDFFDQAGWVHAISQALAHPDSHVAMRHAARARAQQQFDLKTVCLPQQMQWLASLLDLP